MSPFARYAIAVFLVVLSGCGPAKDEAEKKKQKEQAQKKVARDKKGAQAKSGPKTKAKGKAKQAPVPQLPGPPPIMLAREEIDDGWISLFDGVTLVGWVAENKADWKVDQGTITVTSGEQGLLRTTTAFGNYRLRLEFKSDPKTNSGIFLHTPGKPKNPQVDCYELNIAPDDNPFPTGSLVGRGKVAGSHQSDDWQAYEVTVNDGQVTVQLDGKMVMNYSDPKPLRRGYIGLQLNQGKVAFRNIRLKPLGLKAIFNGKDLSDWTTYPKMGGEFVVTPRGELHVRGGKGQIESNGRYGDFVLQLQCRTNTKETNSGVFFRCIPGDEIMGYESQIHNGFHDGDRANPMDWGTGAIFRRMKARRVVADDLQWFSKTIIAEGPHIAVWVNGYQVTDWVDQRKPDVNPRRGLRLAPGTIMLQAHDEGTDVSFRKMSAAEIAARQE